MTSPNLLDATVKFGPFEVTNQVFLRTARSFGLVNLKPLLPGHVLICPLEPHRRLSDLGPNETADLFTTVQLAQRLLARAYFPRPDPAAGSFTVAVQDGAEAGQTVPHVHVHVIPRVKGGADQDRPDELYERMATEEGNVGGALWDRETGSQPHWRWRRPSAGGGVPKIDDEDRKARTAAEMEEEVDTYKRLLREMGVEWDAGHRNHTGE